MIAARTLLLALLALLFTVGGVARAAPCHALPAAQHHAPRDKAPEPDMMVLNCCLGCLPSAPDTLTVGAPGQTAARIAFEARATLRDGLALTPELGPPRRLA